MTEQIKQESRELVAKYFNFFPKYVTDYRDAALEQAKQCALICVNMIIAANPHSNPLNTNVHSTMSYWMEIKKEIENL